MLEAEIKEYLGYSKYDYTNKNTTNYAFSRRYQIKGYIYN